MVDDRYHLANAQRALLASLVSGAEPPDGFDRARIHLQAAALIAKRRGEVARVRPDLPRTLGSRYRELFNAYAANNPKPPGGSRDDAAAFTDYLSR